MNSIGQDKYRFEYQQKPHQEDEQILFEGINDEAVLKKEMDRINPFGIFIKDAHGLVFGGVSGITYYGCLYVDMHRDESTLDELNALKKNNTPMLFPCIP
ncbi:MAG: hypothetical protein WCG42_02635 [Parachlamydiaceae bacterium]